MLSVAWPRHQVTRQCTHGDGVESGSIDCGNGVTHESLGLERIHQVTNTIRIANTGWRIRI